MLRKVQLVGRSRIGPAWLGFNVSDPVALEESIGGSHALGIELSYLLSASNYKEL